MTDLTDSKKEADCIFCKIIAGDIPSAKIHEDEEVFVFADINPVNLGHSLIIPKKHYTDISDTPDETLGKLIVTAKKIAEAIKKAVKADGINIEMNNGKAAGQIIFHSHIHVIPRFIDDGYRHWKGPEKTAEEIRGVAEKIRIEISNREL